MYCPAAIASHTTRVRATRRKSPTREASARNTCGCTRRSQKVTISWRASRLSRSTRSLASAATVQSQTTTGLRSRHEALDDLSGAVARAIVHDDHLERRVACRQHGAHTAFDVLGLVAGGNDHGDERADGLRWVVGEAGTATRVADHDQRQQGEVTRRDDPDHILL